MEDQTRAGRRKWTDDQLIAAVATSENMSQVIFKLGLSVKAAANRTTVKKYIKKLNLSTEHWTGQAWVGTRNYFPTEAKPLVEILVEYSTYSTGHLRLRLLKEGLKKHQCESCQLTEWMNQPIPLELDHINGNPFDHRIENLMVLCPNCHALTPTWRGRNIGRLTTK